MPSSPPSAPSSPGGSERSVAVTMTEFESLPIRGMKEKIVGKIMENRVTLIVGETGCGKSSQVPLFLRDENMTPILCTQPRRFAVVAVAKMVAKILQCEVGEEVAYHIGHSKVLSNRSRIIFKTAGVLLEEMREKGPSALKYKVIILDEVHERSVESDLVLACVKQFLIKNNDIRLVLMSATADFGRYREYFRDLGRGERVEVLAIPSSSQHSSFQRKVLYLEQVSELLGTSLESSESLSTKYCSGPSPLVGSAEMKAEVHELIHDLVLHIHENEPDIEKSILVFLPTYYSLEQQWYLLMPLSSCFKVHILHSSVDTDQALSAMKIWKSHRKVILATNIAESSVTIPQVAHVIDSCRSLQVFWDGARKRDTPELVWVSKSQANQRKGRTGRTCDGTIYRLVTGSFFGKLQEYESPAVLKLSLRLQVLLLCCAESKSINDPKALLQRALDPPDVNVVEDALRVLVNIKAIKKVNQRGRYEPTFYGLLLSSFSLSFDAAVLILKFGGVGMLREGILLGILMDIQPKPIVRPFGQESLFNEYTGSYYAMEVENPSISGRKEVAFMGNLCAFQFWQRVFKDKLRLEHLKQLLNVDDMRAPQALIPKIEGEWCSFHNLLQSSLHQISDIYNEVLSSLHKYRPKFLATSSGLPSFYDPYEFRHTCLLQRQSSDDTVTLPEDDEYSETKCIAVPFVASNDFQTQAVAKKFANIIKEIRVENMGDSTDNQDENLDEYGSLVTGDVCRFFLKGLCNRGTDCLFTHSLQAKRPLCKFFTTLQGCRNGDSCFFSHDTGVYNRSPITSTLCVPEDQDQDPETIPTLIKLFPETADGRILILDDTDLRFSTNISRYYDAPKITSTTIISEVTIFDPSLSDVTILWGIRSSNEMFISTGRGSVIPWDEVKCVLWFPDFESCGDNEEQQKRHVEKFFKRLAVRILADMLFEMRVVLTMNNIRFAQLQVEKLGRECFFFLAESFPYDESSFGELTDTVTTKKKMVVSKPVSYVFDLHPPSDLQFGDYTTALHRSLHPDGKEIR